MQQSQLEELFPFDLEIDRTCLRIRQEQKQVMTQNFDPWNFRNQNIIDQAFAEQNIDNQNLVEPNPMEQAFVNQNMG